jgi:hypothetical protein
VISPWAKHGYIDHQILSFDAYLKFIEDDFLGGQRIDPQTDGRPDPRIDVPPRRLILSEQPVAALDESGPIDANSSQDDEETLPPDQGTADSALPMAQVSDAPLYYAALRVGFDFRTVYGKQGVSATQPGWSWDQGTNPVM